MEQQLGALSQTSNAQQSQRQLMFNKTPAQQLLAHHLAQTSQVVASGSAMNVDGNAMDLDEKSVAYKNTSALDGQAVLNAQRIQDLVSSISPNETLEPIVEEVGFARYSVLRCV